MYNRGQVHLLESLNLLQLHPDAQQSRHIYYCTSGSSEWTRVDEDKVLNIVARATSVTKGSLNTSRKTKLEKQAPQAGVVDELLEKLAVFLKLSRGRRQVTKLHFLYFLDSGGQSIPIHFSSPLKALGHRGCTLPKNFTKTHPAFNLQSVVAWTNRNDSSIP